MPLATEQALLDSNLLRDQNAIQDKYKQILIELENLDKEVKIHATAFKVSEAALKDAQAAEKNKIDVRAWYKRKDLIYLMDGVAANVACFSLAYILLR